MMRNIVLHGELGDTFIKSISLNVNSVLEVISALRANFPNFSNFLINYKPGFYIKVNSEYRDKDGILLPISSNEDTIHIIPAITGSGGKLGMIVVGAFLIWATAGAGSYMLGALGGSVGAGATTFGIANATIVGIAGSIGVGLVLSGISAILFAPPKQTAAERNTSEPNRYFNGVVNTVSQGIPVPIGYGKLIVGSTVISAGVTIDEIPPYVPPATVDLPPIPTDYYDYAYDFTSGTPVPDSA